MGLCKMGCGVWGQECSCVVGRSWCSGGRRGCLWSCGGGDGFKVLLHHGQHCWWVGHVGLFYCSELVLQDSWIGESCVAMPELCDWMLDRLKIARVCCEGANRHHPVADMGTNCSNKITISKNRWARVGPGMARLHLPGAN